MGRARLITHLLLSDELHVIEVESCVGAREEKSVRTRHADLFAENNAPHAKEGNTAGCRFCAMCVRCFILY